MSYHDTTCIGIPLLRGHCKSSQSPKIRAVFVWWVGGWMPLSYWQFAIFLEVHFLFFCWSSQSRTQQDPKHPPPHSTVYIVRMHACGNGLILAGIIAQLTMFGSVVYRLGNTKLRMQQYCIGTTLDWAISHVLAIYTVNVGGWSNPIWTAVRILGLCELMQRPLIWLPTSILPVPPVRTVGSH